MMGNGFVAKALPTARAAFGFPRCGGDEPVGADTPPRDAVLGPQDGRWKGGRELRATRSRGKTTASPARNASIRAATASIAAHDERRAAGYRFEAKAAAGAPGLERRTRKIVGAPLRLGPEDGHGPESRSI